MKDVIDELQSVLRTVGPGKVPAGEAQMVVLRRTYRADIEDVWDAITNPERIARWFLPVTGEFRVGGTYQLEGNAGGEILACEPPSRLFVTSMFGEAPPGSSEVEVRLSRITDDETMLVLQHSAVVPPDMWDRYGPGAVGVGWDLTVLGLSGYLDGELSHWKRWKVENHMRGCPECAGLLRDLEDMTSCPLVLGLMHAGVFLDRHRPP